MYPCPLQVLGLSEYLYIKGSSFYRSHLSLYWSDLITISGVCSSKGEENGKGEEQERAFHKSDTPEVWAWVLTVRSKGTTTAAISKYDANSSSQRWKDSKNRYSELERTGWYDGVGIWYSHQGAQTSTIQDIWAKELVREKKKRISRPRWPCESNALNATDAFPHETKSIKKTHSARNSTRQSAACFRQHPA